jgi:hypothetical protein
LTESALWAGALSWWRIKSSGQSSGFFNEYNCFYGPNLFAHPQLWYLKVYMIAPDSALFNIFICSVTSLFDHFFHHLTRPRGPPEPLMSVQNTWLFQSFSPVSLEERSTNATCKISYLHTTFNVDLLY